MDQKEEPPLNTHQQHSEEVEHHENGASKMLRKVKARAKKFKNSLTKHGQSNEHDHDVVEEDDDDDELDPEVISPPGVTSKQPESLSHPRETNVPAPEEIIPPGTKVFPVVSSDYTKPVESVPLQDTSYGHDAPAHSVRTTGISDKEEHREAPAHSVRTTDISDKEERREAPTHHPLSELSDREESREAHHEPLNTPVSLLSGTEDVTRTSAPSGEDDHLGGQRKVNFETPIKVEDDPAVLGGGSDYLSGVSDYHSKVTDPTKEGSGEAESLGLMKIADESPEQKPGQGFDRDLSTRSKEFRTFDQDFDSVLAKDSSPAKFAGESEAELEKDSSVRSHDFDMKTESGVDKSSPSRSHEFDLKTEYGVDKNSRMGFGSESGAELGRELPTGSSEFDQKIESGINEYSPESDGGLGAPLGGNFPVRSHELDVKNESGIDKDSPTGFDGEPDFLAQGRPGYGEDSEERNSPVRSDDVKEETKLERDLSTEAHDGSSSELSRPKEKDEFEESRDDFEETRDETTQETKPKAYTEQFASMLGYSGETPVGDKTQVAGTVDDEKLTPVNEKDQETESAVTKKLPLPGGGSGVEETVQGEEKGVSGRDYVAEKLTSEEEDKAFSDMIAEKLKIGGGGGGEEKEATTTKEVTVEKIPTEKASEESEHGEAVDEEVKGGGMVGMIKGWFGSGATEEVKPKSPHSVEEAPQSPGWFGGGTTTGEVKPKSPHSVEESPQSLGSTVGTKGFPDTVGGAEPVQKGI